EAVDDDLAMTEVHPGLNDDGFPDAHLRRDNGKPVCEPRAHGNAKRVEAGLCAVTRQREEPVAHPHQAERVQERVRTVAERRELSAGGSREVRVREQGCKETRLP